MLKKLIVVSILLLSLTFASNPARAASCPSVLESAYVTDDGWYYADYSIAGNLRLTVTFTNYISATITLPKLENLANLAEEEGIGELFVFWPDDLEDFSYGSFGDTLLYGLSPETFGSFGTWEQSGCNLYIDYSPLVNLLVDTLTQSGIDAAPSGSTKITAKIAKDGSHSGRINIKLNIYEPLPGSLSLSMTFKSYPVVYEYDPKIKKDKVTLRPNVKKSKATLSPEIKNFLSSVLSKLPQKGAVPKK